MDEEKIKKLEASLQEVEGKIPLFQGNLSVEAVMLERLFRPFFVAGIENKNDFSIGTLDALIEQVLQQYGAQADFPQEIKNTVQERYELGKQIDWFKEVVYTTSTYNHPLVQLVKYVFKHLSPEGQAVVARHSLENLS